MGTNGGNLRCPQESGISPFVYNSERTHLSISTTKSKYRNVHEITCTKIVAKIIPCHRWGDYFLGYFA